ncbi:MAG: hypothetical protein EAX87_11350 [Candidatus Thorarchaeota archaeon]|nr:hypothetical protein [Candidatus Thorarchaeota archaeon]
MSEDWDESVTNQNSVSNQNEARMNKRRVFVIDANIIFGMCFFILGLWLTTQYIYYVPLPPFNILMFWGSYRAKYSEFQEIISKGSTPKTNTGLDMIALVGNMTLLILVILVLGFPPYDYLTTLVIPLFMITMVTFENLGSSFAFIRITGHT